MKRNEASPLILTCASAIGMVTTVIFAVHATPKAMELKKKAEEKKGEALTAVETVKATAKCYIPTVIVGGMTLLCLFGANVTGNKQRAAYISAYGALEKAFLEYRSKVDDIYGTGADLEVRSAVASDTHLTQEIIDAHSERYSGEILTFYEPHRDEFFEMTMEELITAAYHLNRNFALRGYSPLNEFYEFLGLSKTDTGEVIGWSLDSGMAFYGYQWIDFDISKRKLDDGMTYYIISFPFEPTSDYLGEFE